MSRSGILQAYRTAMISYICRTLNIDKQRASDVITETMKERYKAKTAIVAESNVPGNPQLKAMDLLSFMDKHKDNLISPSGAVFQQHEKKMGATINLFLFKLKQRKIFKKAMLKAKSIADEVKASLYKALQTSTKITINALPGNTGSPYSLFYDKANYNAVTSSGRALISYANTCIEHVLGGNFGWFNIDQLINHIAIHLNDGIIDRDAVMRTIKKHGMREVESYELFDFYVKELRIYHKYKDEELEVVRDLVNKLSHEEIQFFWYYQNLRHVFMENDQVFRTWIKNMYDINNVTFEDVDPMDLMKIDGALVTMINVAFNDVVNSGDPDIQVYDLPAKMPDKAKKFVCISKWVEKNLHEIDDIMDVFINTNLCVPDVNNRKHMIRNSSVVSDTDSVIFTVKDWVQWYAGEIYKIVPGTYNIACLMIYLITKAVAHSLKLFSIAHGARGERVYDMAMKNEFLYTTMCLCKGVKKHYAGVVTVQEGVILPEPDPDIKGLQFKGSNMCREATAFAEKFIIENILLESLDKRIEGQKLIDKVIEFEMRIYNDLQEGKTTWLEPESIKNKEDYANDPDSTPHLYYSAWTEIFAHKYGEIFLPAKIPAVPINRPTEDYFNWLREKNPSVERRFRKFFEVHGKYPSKIAISLESGRIPPELTPLVQIRDIIWANTGPERLILKQLGIDCGFEKLKLLFSEVYGKDCSILSMTSNKAQLKGNTENEQTQNQEAVNQA